MIPGLYVVGENAGVLMFAMPSTTGPEVYDFFWRPESGDLRCSCMGFVGHRMTATMDEGGCRHCRSFRDSMRAASLPQTVQEGRTHDE